MIANFESSGSELLEESWFDFANEISLLDLNDSRFSCLGSIETDNKNSNCLSKSYRYEPSVSVN